MSTPDRAEGEGQWTQSNLCVRRASRSDSGSLHRLRLRRPVARFDGLDGVRDAELAPEDGSTEAKAHRQTEAAAAQKALRKEAAAHEGM